MPTIAEMTSGLASTEVTFNTLTIKMNYYPGKVTERVIQRINGFRHATDSALDAAFADLNALVVDLVADWDLTENDGKTMFPLNAKRLPELPAKFLQRVLVATLNDVRPND